MFKMKKLEELKKQIINKLVTEKNVEEIRNKEMLKGGFLKQCFKYIFLKPMFLREINSNVDNFFTDKDGLNFFKGIALVSFFSVSLIGIVGVLFDKPVFPILFCLALFFMFIALFGADWKAVNRKANEKFNIKNIESIRENLFKNYSDYQVKDLLKEKLNKEELTHIIVELEKLIGKDAILINLEETRKLNNYEEIFNDISQPYVLVKLIDKLILNEKEKELNKKDIKKFNNAIIDSILNNVNNNNNEMDNHNVKNHASSINV